MTEITLEGIFDHNNVWWEDDGEGGKRLTWWLLPQAKREFLRRADLRGADLRNANLHEANLSGADLAWADLRGAVLRDADLAQADLHGINLGGADLREANLCGADLAGADLGGANLESASLEGARLGGANLGGAKLGHANDELILEIAEADAEVLHRKCDFAAKMCLAIVDDAERRAAVGYLASMWGCSASTIRKLALVGGIFTEEDFVPGAPLRIYTTAVEIAVELTEPERPDLVVLGAQHWLRLATDADYRRKKGHGDDSDTWSTRQMKETAGTLQGKGESPVTFRSREATVEEWDPERDRLTVTGAGISGDAPVHVKTAVTPLLERER